MTFEHELVKAILSKPHEHVWSLQGFGMLRLYLSDNVRLHVWDARFRNEGVSEMHTHPWNFHSRVIAGVVHNRRWNETPMMPIGEHFRRHMIFCGVGGGLVPGEPELVRCRPHPIEVYEAGQEYTQKAHEIHVSQPEDGTVTIVRREFLEDADHAYIYWPQGQEWVTAEPRTATYDEASKICANALERWF